MSLNAESCPVCFNLEPDQFPEKSQPGLLDEHRLVVPFSQVKSSAKNSDCLSCQIICVGLENIERDWEEGTEPDNTVDQILRDETLLLINLRLGRSLRVTLSNDWYETTLEFYTLSEADNTSIPAFGLAKEVPEELDLSTCLALTTEWMKKCNEEHSSCCQTLISKLPTRVLDLGQNENADFIYLKEASESDHGPYMTLSHCWGKEQIITTTTNTLRDRKAGIKLSQLSNTFRHAVEVTRGLGVRYLWIDSLCIIQDDKLDWEVESARMAEVYMSSQLNLAATHSKNGQGGCFAERWSLDGPNQTELRVGEDTMIVPSDEAEGFYKIFCRHALHVAHDQFTRTMDYAHTTEYASPLLSRAWVFQERLLSRRTLHFHAEELIWECASGLSCECSRLEDHKWGDPDGILELREEDQLKRIYASISLPETTEPQILGIWLDLVSEYCSLKLTNQMDCLPALSGLASRVAKNVRGDYLAGLWSQDLPRALCWLKEGTASSESPTLQEQIPGAPSWSWASTWTYDDHVNINYGLVQTAGFVTDWRCQIRGFQCSTSSSNRFGNCQESSLTVEARFIQATLVENEIDRSEYFDQMRKGSLYQQNLAKYLDAHKHEPSGAIAKYVSRKLFAPGVLFDREFAGISGDCTDIEGRMTTITHGDTVWCILLGQFKLSKKESMNESRFHSQYLTREDRARLEEPSSQVRAAYALVLQKFDGGSTYKRVGLLVQREGPRWWKDAEVAQFTLV